MRKAKAGSTSDLELDEILEALLVLAVDDVLVVFAFADAPLLRHLVGKRHLRRDLAEVGSQ